MSDESRSKKGIPLLVLVLRAILNIEEGSWAIFLFVRTKQGRFGGVDRQKPLIRPNFGQDKCVDYVL